MSLRGATYKPLRKKNNKKKKENDADSKSTKHGKKRHRNYKIKLIVALPLEASERREPLSCSRAAATYGGAGGPGGHGRGGPAGAGGGVPAGKDSAGGGEEDLLMERIV